jgi:serine/threonine-protein kinase RsbW
MYFFDKSICSSIKGIDLGLEEKAHRYLLYQPADLRPVQDVLENWMRVLGYLHRDIFAVTLVLYEAVTNALRHGHHNDPTKPVTITYLVTPAEVLVQVEDQGSGFDHENGRGTFAEKILDPRGGRGLYLMHAYSSSLGFMGAGNRVTFCRRRSQ